MCGFHFLKLFCCYPDEIVMLFDFEIQQDNICFDDYRHTRRHRSLLLALMWSARSYPEFVDPEHEEYEYNLTRALEAIGPDKPPRGHLAELDLAWCGLSGRAVEALCEGLMRQSTLTVCQTCAGCLIT